MASISAIFTSTYVRIYVSHKAAKSMAKLLSQLYGELQPAVYLSRGDGAI